MPKSRKWQSSFLIFFVTFGGVFFSFSGSAYALRTTLIKFLFDIKGNTGSPFDQPTDLAVGKDRFIYVLDGVNHRVKVFDKNGKYKFSFGKKGSGEGELRLPVGLDIDLKGDIFVADSGNHRVEIFDAKGNYKADFSLQNHKTAVPPDPTDVLVFTPRDGDELLFVVDNNNHRVLVFDKDTLKFKFEFGKHGFEETGSFRYPFKLARDRKEYIYVVDVLNTRVQKFSSNGKFDRKYGRWGIQEGTFFRPKGIAIAGDDKVYISDSYMGVVQVFTAGGRYHSVLAENPKLEKKFKTPIHIYFDQYNRFYVIEQLSNKVSVYQLLQE
jgi:tripartite motif-containing protein 71